MSDETDIEISLVIPCLNEAETLEACITRARDTLDSLGVRHEIILSDNGSVDGSQTIARRLGVRVVHVQAKGYGFTVMAGVEASRGRYIVLVDADNRYDLIELRRFIEPLRAGHDLVQGCRLPAGKGMIHPGAMSRINRWFAIPLFSWLARRWFRSTVHDIFCGMRAFSRRAYDRWALRCVGLEFATEMIIKASLFRDRVAEVPVSFYPDRRRIRRPHLKNIKDGWRTLRLFLISCPRWLFLVPGGSAILLGLFGYYLGYRTTGFFGVRFDVHTILLASLIIIMGYQAVLFAGFTILFSINERFLPPDPKVKWLVRRINMERGLFVGLGIFLGGLAFLFSAFLLWKQNQFGSMDYQQAMRRVIPGVTMTAIGFQTVLSGAFMSILGMYRRPSQVQAPPPARPPKPWLSVIMPTYQGGHHLDSALSSIAMQNDSGVEVILVDDGSTDTAHEVVKAWDGVLDLRVIWRKHSGNWVSGTNHGFEAARGDWVCLLHQDDMWTQGRLAAIIDLIRRFPDVDFFFHSVFFINDKGWKVGRWKCPLPGLRKLDPAYVLPRLVVQDFIGIMAPVFRRSLVDRLGPMDESLWYHADWDYWLRLAGAGPVVYDPEPLASFRLHEWSQTARRTKNLDDVARQIDAVTERALASPAFPVNEVARARRVVQFHRTVYLFLLEVMHHQPKRWKALIGGALRIGPFEVIRYIRLSRLIDRLLPRLRFLNRDS